MTCPLCQRQINDDEATTSGMHNLCLLANVTGHVYGVCHCTGWEDPYEAGLEVQRRIKAGWLDDKA